MSTLVDEWNVDDMADDMGDNIRFGSNRSSNGGSRGVGSRGGGSGGGGDGSRGGVGAHESEDPGFGVFGGDQGHHGSHIQPAMQPV